VATKSNGGQVFSYINVKNAFTQGLEFEIEWQPASFLKIASGYQYLQTADKEELNSIKSGKEFTRDPNGTSRNLKRSEYVGLPNRSKNMFNLKFTFENAKKLFATARFIYRSKWAVANRDGNSVYNSNDEFARGFLLLNISAGKELQQGLSLQGGIENVLNYQDLGYLPNLPGRMIYLGIRFGFNK
jgi:outer membrane receptor for ferrienterochelin and colicins